MLEHLQGTCEMEGRRVGADAGAGSARGRHRRRPGPHRGLESAQRRRLGRYLARRHQPLWLALPRAFHRRDGALSRRAASRWSSTCSTSAIGHRAMSTTPARMASIIGRPCRYVVDMYEADRGQGWGVVAQRLGIKPGSAEFHRLKKGFVPTYDRWARPIDLDDELRRAYPDRGKGKAVSGGKSSGKAQASTASGGDRPRHAARSRPTKGGEAGPRHRAAPRARAVAKAGKAATRARTAARTAARAKQGQRQGLRRKLRG